jgi:hypothetical protein
MIKLITSIIITILPILFFKEIQSSLFNSGSSWTTSKALPYLITIILGIIIAINTFKILTIKKVYKFSLATTILILPFAISFALHPIYEGDFSKNGKVLESNSYSENSFKHGLMVITIPNCPYCYQAIDQVKKLALRNPDLKIEYVVCSSDTNTISTYKKEIGGLFNIRLAKDRNQLARVAGGSFPAFVQIKNNKFTYKWSNSQFGVRALDLIEKETKQ